MVETVLTANETAKTETARARLLIADDHRLILDALTAMLESEYDVQGVETYPAFIASVDTFRPDVVLLDVSSNEVEGFSAARAARERIPELPVVLLSTCSEPAFLQRARDAGAKAYFSNDVAAGELLAGIRAVLRGENLMPPTLEPSSARGGSAGLTARQVEVLRLIAGGSTAKEIAERLQISVRTAEFHRAAIMQRLNLHSTAQMTRYALAHNLA